MILNVDRKQRAIQLSIKARDNAETAEQLESIKGSAAQSGTTSLGALLKAKLDEAKDEE